MPRVSRWRVAGSRPGRDAHQQVEQRNATQRRPVPPCSCHEIADVEAKRTVHAYLSTRPFVACLQSEAGHSPYRSEPSHSGTGHLPIHPMMTTATKPSPRHGDRGRLQGTAGGVDGQLIVHAGCTAWAPVLHGDGACLHSK